MTPPGPSNQAIVRYLHVRWALGDRRRQTHQLWRFREHGGRVSEERWSRCWGLALHRWKATRPRPFG